MFLIDRDGWRRTVFELAIVSLGVFVALVADGWNERRIDRRLERDYLTRIRADVAADTAALRSIATALDSKLVALAALAASSASQLGSLSDSALATQLVLGHGAGFGVLRGNATTFEDLRGTGSLGLIEDSNLRIHLARYYESWAFNSARVEARRSPFPTAMYGLLPNEVYASDVSFDSPANRQSATLDRTEITRYLLSPEGRQGLRGEANYGRFFRGVVSDLLTEARALLVALG